MESKLYTIESLVKILKYYESSNESETEQWLIDVIAKKVLMTEYGQCHVFNMRALKQAGYDVYAGEKDEFGWIKGCIKTTRGVVLFG